MPEVLAPHMGERFGRLEIIGFAGRTQNSRKLAVCKCDCGWFIDLPMIRLRSGNSTSCGCAHRDYMKVHNEELVTHGHSRGGKVTPEYQAYQAMVSRCHSTTHEFYENYGGRGITVCARWRRSFEAFLEDLGPRPSNQHSLERTDNDKGYTPGNCRWATSKEQHRNMTTNKLFLFDGEHKTLAEWAELYGYDYNTIYLRVVRFKWTVEEAVSTPVGGGGRAPNGNVPERERMRGVWGAMKDRCANPNHVKFARYGGRGITVCARWRDSFETFLNDVGPRPSPKHTLDRTDNSRGYAPDNVRWATSTEQNRNRDSTRFFEIDGERRTLADWADRAGQPYALMRHRIHEGWPIKEALGTPVGARGLGRRIEWKKV